MMPSALCCTLPERSNSPSLPNARIITSPQPTQSSETQAKNSVLALLASPSEDFQSLHRIFANASFPQSDAEAAATPGSDCKSGDAKRLTNERVRRSPSFTVHLRRRLSRKSVKSSKSLGRDSKRASKHDVLASSEEEERSLKQRLEEELLSDKAVEDGGYDADALSLVVTEAIKLDSLKPSDALRNLALRIEKESSQSLTNSYDWLGPMLDGAVVAAQIAILPEISASMPRLIPRDCHHQCRNFLTVN
ncbi:hypothetical protein BJ546DRAFT_154540 [Cryomyces antarcticus]